MAEAGWTRRDVLAAGAALGLTAGCADDPVLGETPEDAGQNLETSDAGGPDGGTTTPDAGSMDAGQLDAGAPDAGGQDGGVADGGTDPIAAADRIPPSPGFDAGVASGDVTMSEAIVWTQYSGLHPLRAIVWKDGEPNATFWADTPVSDGGVAKIEATGLDTNALYRYAFVELDRDRRLGRSPIGTFRTAPAPDALIPLVFGASACTQNNRDPAPLERAAERDDLAFFILAGDTTYNDGARTLTQYRQRWQENLRKPGYRNLRAKTSLLATWDDHEVDNNWNPETIDPGQLAAATDAFFEALPLYRDLEAPSRLWKSRRWGQTAEVFVLDCRGERRPSTRRDPDAQYISPEQMAWLEAGLSESDAVFKIIINSVPISDFPGAFDLSPDRWEAYPAQRERILRFIEDESISGVLWLAGDFHLASVGRVATSGLGSSQLEVLAGPGAQIPNPLVATLRAPQFDFVTGRNNYASFSLDPMSRSVRIAFHAGNGDVLYEETYVL